MATLPLGEGVNIFDRYDRTADLGSERIEVSSISTWKIALKVKHLSLSSPCRSLITFHRDSGWKRPRFQPWMYKQVRELDLLWENRDPAGRMIVALTTR